MWICGSKINRECNKELFKMFGICEEDMWDWALCNLRTSMAVPKYLEEWAKEKQKYYICMIFYV